MLGRLLIDDSRVQVGVNRHLFAWHGVESESCDDLRNASCTLCHDNEVDDHEDQEDDETHYVIARNDKFTEGLNDFACCVSPGVPVNQHHSGRGHIEAEPQQCGDQ